MRIWFVLTEIYLILYQNANALFFLKNDNLICGKDLYDPTKVVLHCLYNTSVKLLRDCTLRAVPEGIKSKLILKIVNFPPDSNCLADRKKSIEIMLTELSQLSQWQWQYLQWMVFLRWKPQSSFHRNELTFFWIASSFC